MKKEFSYLSLKFSAETVRSVYQKALVVAAARVERAAFINSSFDVTERDGAKIGYDSIEQFEAAYRHSDGEAFISISGADIRFFLIQNSEWTKVIVDGPTQLISEIFSILDQAKIASQKSFPPPTIFIGHGRKTAWKDLRDHLRDHHHQDVLTYESEPHGGHLIPEVVEGYVKRCRFGLLVFTGEDKQADGKLRARQNVVHELGMVTNEVGRSRAMILLENHTEVPSNLSGVECIPFSEGNIQATYGPVLAALRREFG